MLDLVIRNATVVDGTGTPARTADVGISDGRVVEVGVIDDDAAQTIDADGLVVTPGFIDPHTHYDAQLFWDPYATPSNTHGVTTVLGGNCGFTLAPLRPRDADYTRHMMARVEGMTVAALEEGVPWNWDSFGDYLEALETRQLGVNAGFLVGHCALRRYVMGADAVGGDPTDEQLSEMSELLRTSIEAGALGFSTSQSSAHVDGDGEPVASRHARRDELLALCSVVAQHEGTTLEAVVEGCLDVFSDDEIELLSAMSATADRPLNWNVLTIDSAAPERLERQLSASDTARQQGGRLLALTMPVQVPMTMSLLNYCALFSLPGWKDVLGLPVPQRIERLRDPEVRRWMQQRATSPEAGVYARLADFGRYVIGDTHSPRNEGLSGRVVADIAAERGSDPFDMLLDIAIEDELRTVLWPMPPDNDDASWRLRAEAWEDPRTLLGGSDAGAHLDRMCGAPYPTRFLGDTLRGRRLLPIERAVQMITDEPARVFGLTDRGRIAPGYHADLVVLDPAAVGADDATLVHDLPADSPRLVARARGIRHVFVNGVLTVDDGVATGALPGGVLRSGRDTYTVTAADA